MVFFFFFFKQKTAYEMRISDWSSDVCSSDLMTASVEGPMTAATINPDEAAHFGRLAADWWNPSGESAMLHRLNPVRLAYVRERIDSHFGASRRDRHPLAGRTALDVGCGAEIGRAHV